VLLSTAGDDAERHLHFLLQLETVTLVPLSTGLTSGVSSQDTVAGQLWTSVERQRLPARVAHPAPLRVDSINGQVSGSGVDSPRTLPYPHTFLLDQLMRRYHSCLSRTIARTDVSSPDINAAPLTLQARRE
jgi:hypothetical protein